MSNELTILNGEREIIINIVVGFSVKVTVDADKFLIR